MPGLLATFIYKSNHYLYKVNNDTNFVGSIVLKQQVLSGVYATYQKAGGIRSTSLFNVYQIPFLLGASSCLLRRII